MALITQHGNNGDGYYGTGDTNVSGSGHDEYANLWDFNTVLPYHGRMGFQVTHGGTDYYLPDPSSWNYTVGDLDSSGSRDANGLLHRSYVATKVNYELEWNAIEWSMLEYMLKAVQSDKFTFYGPDPRNYLDRYSGDYYVGDRTGSATYFLPGKEETAMYTLKMKFIEY